MEQKHTEQFTERSITLKEAEEIQKNAKEAITVNEALNRLCNNADFKLVFLQEYIEKAPSRLTLLLGDPSLNYGGRKNEHREDIQECLIGIARFSEYMRKISLEANMAQKELDMLLDAEKRFYDSSYTEEE